MDIGPTFAHAGRSNMDVDVHTADNSDKHGGGSNDMGMYVYTCSRFDT